MPNPIILIFSYNQVPAGEILFQTNLPGLVTEGYKTFLDEEAVTTTLAEKLEVSKDFLKQADLIPADSEGSWQKEIVRVKKDTIDLLVKNQFNYYAYDIPQQAILALTLKNLRVINNHPKGYVQGFNELMSGKIADHQEAWEMRVAFQDAEFTQHARAAKDGVICITGIYHARHLQSYLQTKFPDQDILSFFPYQGPSFEPYEDEARNSDTNSFIFPYNARLVDMDKDADKAQNCINEELAIYKTLTTQLAQIAKEFKQGNVVKTRLDESQTELQILKVSCKKLTSLNNVDKYLLAIDVHLLQCAMGNKDLDYIRNNYPAIKARNDKLVKSEFKENLVSIAREVVTKYREETKPEKTAAAPGIFNNAISTTTAVDGTLFQPK